MQTGSQSSRQISRPWTCLWIMSRGHFHSYCEFTCHLRLAKHLKQAASRTNKQISGWRLQHITGKWKSPQLIGLHLLPLPSLPPYTLRYFMSNTKNNHIVMDSVQVAVDLPFDPDTSQSQTGCSTWQSCRQRSSSTYACVSKAIPTSQHFDSCEAVSDQYQKPDSSKS
jgi:hypothetical protein